VRYNKKGTPTSREIQTAVRLILAGELAKRGYQGRDQVHLVLVRSGSPRSPKAGVLRVGRPRQIIGKARRTRPRGALARTSDGRNVH
jgi:hypothetical protein